MKTKFSSALKYIKLNKSFLCLFTLAILSFLFVRNYQLQDRAQFTWDQVDTAWHAKNLIVDGVYPLEGMPAKQNTGVTIGPFYYYFVSFFYFITDLDPIASPLVASFVSALSLVALIYACYKIFNRWVALIAVLLAAFSNYLIVMDRIQWPVGFVPAVGILIFLSLHQIHKKKYKYFFLLMSLLGFSLHTHFTSIFYFLIVVLYVPFLNFNKKSLYSFLISLPLFIVWVVPFVISSFNSSTNLNIINFFSENNVGLHLRRVLQVAEIAFAENGLIIGNSVPFWIGMMMFPIFLAIYLRGKSRDFAFIYLVAIWIIVPWVFLSMFRGDLTPYYFAGSRFLSISILAYIIYSLITSNRKILIPVFILIFSIYIFTNMNEFINYGGEGIAKLKKTTLEKFKRSAGNEFTYGSGESYLYYYYERLYYGKDYHKK